MRAQSILLCSSKAGTPYQYAQCTLWAGNIQPPISPSFPTLHPPVFGELLSELQPADVGLDWGQPQTLLRALRRRLATQSFLRSLELATATRAGLAALTLAIRSIHRSMVYTMFHTNANEAASDILCRALWDDLSACQWLYASVEVYVECGDL